MSDSLNDLMNTIMAHPAATELLSLIPAVGGAVLQARRGRVGGPLGAGLEVLGQYGLDKAQQGAKLQETTAHNQSLSKLLSGITPQTKLQDVLKKGAEVGLDPSDVIGGYQAVSPAQKPGLKRDPYTDWVTKHPNAPLSEFYNQKPTKPGPSPWKYESYPGVAPYWVNTETQETRPAKGAPTRGFAPERPPAGSYATVTNKDGSIAGFYNPTTGDFKLPPVAGFKGAPKAPSSHEAAILDWLSRNPGKSRIDAEAALAGATSGARRGPRLVKGGDGKEYAVSPDGKSATAVEGIAGAPSKQLPLRKGADGRWYVVDPATKTSTPVSGMPSAPPSKGGKGKAAPGNKLVNIKTPSGLTYQLTTKGDPAFGYGARAGSGGFFGKSPGFVWRVDGKMVDPTTLSPERKKALAMKLFEKGFTPDELRPPPSE